MMKGNKKIGIQLSCVELVCYVGDPRFNPQFTTKNNQESFTADKDDVGGIQIILYLGRLDIDCFIMCYLSTKVTEKYSQLFISLSSASIHSMNSRL